MSVSLGRNAQASGTYLQRLVIERFPVILELAFYPIRVPCTPVVSAESPAKMLVSWPYNEAGTYLAVVAFPGTIFFMFLNFALLVNCWSSGQRLGLDSVTSSSVRLSSE